MCAINPHTHPPGMAVRLFEQATHAQLYAKFRPTYPRTVLETICNFITKHGGRFDAAADIACGSGQSTFYLCERFKQCVGVDISTPQVEEGRKEAQKRGIQNVEFKVGSAYDLPVEDSSMNLVACAQAWHWLEPEVFYKEADRALRSHGCLAVYGYSNCELANKECNQLVSHFYSYTLKGCWHAGRNHIDDLYYHCRLPYEVTERYDLQSPTSMALPDFIGYISSWSGYRKYLERNPETTVLARLQEQMQAVLEPSAEGQTPQVDMVFPIFLLLGLKGEK